MAKFPLCICTVWDCNSLVGSSVCACATHTPACVAMCLNCTFTVTVPSLGGTSVGHALRLITEHGVWRMALVYCCEFQHTLGSMYLLKQASKQANNVEKKCRWKLQFWWHHDMPLPIHFQTHLIIQWYSHTHGNQERLLRWTYLLFMNCFTMLLVDECR